VITLGIPLSGTGGRCSFCRYVNYRGGACNFCMKYLNKVIKRKAKDAFYNFFKEGL